MPSGIYALSPKIGFRYRVGSETHVDPAAPLARCPIRSVHVGATVGGEHGYWNLGSRCREHCSRLLPAVPIDTWYFTQSKCELGTPAPDFPAASDSGHSGREAASPNIRPKACQPGTLFDLDFPRKTPSAARWPMPAPRGVRGLHPPKPAASFELDRSQLFHLGQPGCPARHESEHDHLVISPSQFCHCVSIGSCTYRLLSAGRHTD